MSAHVHGYHVDVYQSLWDRPKTWGALRIWAAAWLIVVLYLALLLLVAGTMSALTYVGLSWFGGQAILVALTQWDKDWDRIMIRWLFRRGRHYYRAG